MTETEQKTEVQQQEEERPSEWSELTGLLRQMQEDTAEQKKYARRQYRLMQVCTGIFGCLLAVVLVAGLVLYPKINALMGQSEAVLTNLQSATSDIAQLDYAGTLGKVDSLLEKGEDGVAEMLESVKHALEILESIDIQKLNTAINDLQTAIAPIANLFGRK